MRMNRRTVLRSSAITSAGLGLTTMIPYKARATGKTSPADKVNMALIGCRNHGFKILRDHLNFDDTNCVGICDVDSNVLDEKANELVTPTYRAPWTLPKIG